jgi:hypothetical protein
MIALRSLHTCVQICNQRFFSIKKLPVLVLISLVVITLRVIKLFVVILDSWPNSRGLFYFPYKKRVLNSQPNFDWSGVCCCFRHTYYFGPWLGWQSSPLTGDSLCVSMPDYAIREAKATSFDINSFLNRDPVSVLRSGCLDKPNQQLLTFIRR